MAKLSETARQRGSWVLVAVGVVIGVVGTVAWVSSGGDDYVWAPALAVFPFMTAAIMSPSSSKPPRPSRLDAWRGGPPGGDGSVGDPGGGGCGGGGD